jgi:hypothetical protein
MYIYIHICICIYIYIHILLLPTLHAASPAIMCCAPQVAQRQGNWPTKQQNPKRRASRTWPCLERLWQAACRQNTSCRTCDGLPRASLHQIDKPALRPAATDFAKGQPTMTWQGMRAMGFHSLELAQHPSPSKTGPETRAAPSNNLSISKWLYFDNLLRSAAERTKCCCCPAAAAASAATAHNSSTNFHPTRASNVRSQG